MKPSEPVRGGAVKVATIGQTPGEGVVPTNIPAATIIRSVLGREPRQLSRPSGAFTHSGEIRQSCGLK